MEHEDIQQPLSKYTTTLLASIVCLALYFFFYKKKNHVGNLPPGPKPVPLYGNLLDINKSDCNGPGIFDKWADEFGAIYSVRYGSYDGVVLNTLDTIREVLVNQGHKSSGRPNNLFYFRVMRGIYGIGLTEGQQWKSTRRAALQALRDFGMGKSSLEATIQEEASAVVDAMDQHGGKPFDPLRILHNATINVICSIVFGKRLEYSDPDFTFVSDSFERHFSSAGVKNPELFVPLLTPLMPIMNPNFFKATKVIFQLRKFIKKKIQEEREIFDPNHIASFIDIYLKANQEAVKDITVEKDILASILDLFGAGSESSSTSLRWALLYLVNYPEVQAKCQQEIAKVIGRMTIPTTSDRDRLLYTQATMYEIQRIVSIGAYGSLHRATDDIEVAGYTIPKGYLIMTNLYHVHMDPEYWGDPKVFRPERWLGEDGELIKHQSFMPFSAGPRECLGKNLALQEFFLILVSLLQKFTFKAVNPKKPPAIKGVMGISHMPDNYQIIASRYEL